MSNNVFVDILQSGYAKLLKDSDTVYLAIDMKAVLDDKITVRVHNVEVVKEEEMLVPCEKPALKVTITPAIQTFYQTHNMSDQLMIDDVLDYLERVADMWAINNRTASAVTRSLVGKVSKSFTRLNEQLFSKAGGEFRDTCLVELIKCNMPILEEFWAKNK